MINLSISDAVSVLSEFRVDFLIACCILDFRGFNFLSSLHMNHRKKEVNHFVDLYRGDGYVVRSLQDRKMIDPFVFCIFVGKGKAVSLVGDPHYDRFESFTLREGSGSACVYDVGGRSGIFNLLHIKLVPGKIVQVPYNTGHEFKLQPGSVLEFTSSEPYCFWSKGDALPCMVPSCM